MPRTVHAVGRGHWHSHPRARVGNRNVHVEVKPRVADPVLVADALLPHRNMRLRAGFRLVGHCVLLH